MMRALNFSVIFVLLAVMSSPEKSVHSSVPSSPPSSPRTSTASPGSASSSTSCASSSPVSSQAQSPRSASPPSSPRKRARYDQVLPELGDAESEIGAGADFTNDGQHNSSADNSDGDDNHQGQQDQRMSSEISSDSSSSDASSVYSAPSTSEKTSDSDVSVSATDSDESRDGSEVDSDEDFVQKLYPGSSKTTDEAVLALMELYVTKRWHQATLKGVLSYCSEFFPSNLPKTVYQMFKYVEDLTPSDYKEIKHYYCSDCLAPKAWPEEKCQKCEISDFGVFFELPLAAQIKHFFEYRRLASLIDQHNSQVRDDSIISDICSGSRYKELRRTVNGIYDVTLSFFIDGVSLVKSSEAHLYPVLATLCEVPPEYRLSFMLVCGIWYDPKSSPIMNNFLTPFVNSLMELSVEGVKWTHPTTKKEMTSLVVAPLLVADGVARADVLRQQQCTSKYSCNTCEQKAVQVTPTVEPTRETTAQPKKPRKLRRFVYQEQPARLRTQSRMDAQGEKAERTNKPVKGITGKAVVSKIPYFDRSSSTPPEYMHSILLGVVKRLLTLWFIISGEWNISAKMKDIDSFIQKNVKVTDEFTRIPKGVKKMPKWKASEFRTWLLYVSLPALINVLPDKYFEHYMLLVSSMYLLLQEKTSQRDLSIAEIQIKLFVRDIGLLYRNNDYVYNTHSMLHLCQYARWWGNPWATSAIKFEGFNFVLANLAHGTKHKGQEIVNRVRLAQGVEILKCKVRSTGEGHNSKPDSVLGCAVNMTSELADFALPDGTETYQRARFKKTDFTSKLYDEGKRRANSYIQYKTTEGSTRYGQIRCFYLKDNGEISAVIKVFKVEHTNIFFHREGKFKVNHLVPVSETDTFVSVPLSNFTMKLAKVGSYLCIRPNKFEANL